MSPNARARRSAWTLREGRREPREVEGGDENEEPGDPHPYQDTAPS